MRTAVPAGYSLWEIVLKAPYSDRRQTCTLGFSQVGAQTQATSDLQHDAIIAALKGVVFTDWRMEGGRTYNGDGTHNPPFFTTARNVAGLSNNPLQVSPNVSAVFRKQTALGGRKGKGRMYWPGLAEGCVLANGDITATCVGVFNGVLAAFKTSQEALASVGSLYLLGHDFANAPVQITALTIRPRVAGQRKRLRII